MTNRLNGNEYQHVLCCFFHSLLLSLFLPHSCTHTLCLSGLGQSVVIMRYDIEAQAWCVSSFTLDSVAMTLFCHASCFCSMSIALIGKSKSPFYCQCTGLCFSVYQFPSRQNWKIFTYEWTFIWCNFSATTVFLTWWQAIFMESVWYLSKAATSFHFNTFILIDTPLRRLYLAAWFDPNMMNTCMVYMAIQFPLDGFHWCQCFIFWGEGNADLLEREKATAEGFGVITSLSFEMSLS